MNVSLPGKAEGKSFPQFGPQCQTPEDALCGNKRPSRASLLWGSQANTFRLSFKSHSGKCFICFKQTGFGSHINITYEKKRPKHWMECVKKFPLFGCVLSTNLIKANFCLQEA